MTKSGRNPKSGISIRVVHYAMILCAVVIAALLVFMMVQSNGVFSKLSDETGKYIVRQKAAYGLMEASDYLTEMVQRFTLEGDVTYLNNYFDEAFNSRRREAAIISMSENDADQNLVAQLQEAMDESTALMIREYYAMKLVIEAKGIRDYPEQLKPIDLTEEHTFLSPEEKMELAQSMVMGSEYYASKSLIRTKLNTNLETQEQMMNATRQETNAQMMQELSTGWILIAAVAVILLALVILVAKLGTMPLISADESVKDDKPVPVKGAREFRTVAENYNEMYDSLHPKEE